MTPKDQSAARMDLSHIEAHSYQLRRAVDAGDVDTILDHAAEMRRAATRIADLVEPYGAALTAASVHGVAITPALAAACRELLAGVATREAWAEISPLIVESGRRFTGVSPESAGDGKRHPPFGEHYVIEAPSLWALASCALGSACARCSTPIEDAGVELDDGWCCSTCADLQLAPEAYRRRAAVWLRRWTVPCAAGQQGLFGTAPTRRKKART